LNRLLGREIAWPHLFLEAAMGAFDDLRTLFNIRKERKPRPAGPKPRLGAKVCLHDVRFTIQAGLSDELWKWLQELGFREITHSPDRRRYRDIPPSLVTRLFDAARDDWRPVLKQSIRASSVRPAPAARLPARAEG
jgi:hypothetical protein